MGDVVTFLKNGVNSRAELTHSEGVRYLHYGDIHACSGVSLCPASLPSIPVHRVKRLDRLEDGDLVFADASEDIAGVSKSVEIRGADDFEVVSGLHTIAARFDKDVLADGFKGYLQFNHSFATHLRRLAAGTKVLATNRAHIASAELSLPPISEQCAIATALSDVDALLDGLNRLIAKKRDIKQATMQQLLMGQIRLPGFHREWEAVVFGDIVSIRNTKVLSSTTPEGTRCVELDGIGSGGSGRLLSSTETVGMVPKYSFKRGDVLFGRLRAYLRKYWLATFDGICSTEIWPLMPRDERLFFGFLQLIVQTDDFVSAACVSYGTHMPRSDWSVLKEFPVRLPEFSEQAAIASVISDMDAEIAALEARRDKTRALRQGMMQELLTGRTRLV